MSNNSQGDQNANPPLAVPQPRQPRNLQDLLRFAVEAQEAGGSAQAPNPVRARNLDPESREFIANALQAFTVDVTKILVEALDVLRTLNKYNDDPQLYENAFNSIADHVDNIDAAKDFVKIGGFDIAESCLTSRYAEVRWRMADVVAQCAQNNEFCQAEALKKKLLPILLNMTTCDSDEKCRIKSFFAVSNIVRTFEPAMDEFMRLDGFSVILKAMESRIERLENKATFFLSTVLTEKPSVIDKLVKQGFVRHLVTMVTEKEHGFIHEHIISSLLTMVKNDKNALNECRSYETTLLPCLTKFLNNYCDDETFTEEMNHIKDLVVFAFPEDTDVER